MTGARVVELRQYTLHPGRREELIGLFERELIAPQEAAGMDLVGQFRDVDRPDRFVWIRGFRDLEARTGALAAFYGGPAWAAHRDAANATMVDFDDVLLLRPAGSRSPFAGLGDRERTGVGAAGEGASRIVIEVFAADLPDGPSADELVRELDAAPGADPDTLALLVTEPGPNGYPALPVREADVVVRVSRERAGALGAARAVGAAASAVGPRPVQRLTLEPTPRSRLR